MLKRFAFLLLMMFTGNIFSCECPPLSPLSATAVGLYDAVFFGTVDSVSPCTTKGIASVYFTVEEAYKGSLKKNVKIDFDCSSECMMSFMKEEKWLIYAKYQHFDELLVNICSNSRKFFSDPKQDFYQAATLTTFDQEKKFLEENIGVKALVVDSLNSQEADLRPHNDQPSPQSKLWLLLISFGAMLAVYIFTRLKK